MSTLAAPFGFKPVATSSFKPYNGAARAYRSIIDTGAMAVGGVVSLSTKANGASIVAVTADGTAGTRSINSVLGVIVGIDFVDPSGTPQMGTYLPANAVTAGYKNIVVHVDDDPNTIYEVQATGSLTLADIGQNVTTAAFGVSATKKQSIASVTSPSILTTATWRIVEIPTDATNAPGDAFTRVRVRINPGYHINDIATGV